MAWCFSLQGVDICYKTSIRLPLLSVRPTVAFSAIGRHCREADTTLYWAMLALHGLTAYLLNSLQRCRLQQCSSPQSTDVKKDGGC